MLGEVFGARVIREKAAGARATSAAVLGGHVQGCGRGGVDEPLDACCRGGEDDRSRSGNVDLEHGAGIGDAEGVHAGDVVDDLAPGECGFERGSIAEIATDGLAAQRNQALRRTVGSGQGSHRSPGGDEVPQDRATEEAGRPGHKCPASHA